jgi:hypothetical protein
MILFLGHWTTHRLLNPFRWELAKRYCAKQLLATRWPKV